MNAYLDFKFAHLLIAIVGLGSGAAAVLVAEPRLVRKLLYVAVVPGYLLMLITGMWMGHIANLLDAHWTEAAMNIWGIGAIFLALLAWALRRQVRMADAGGRASPGYRRAVWLGRISGGAAALVILVIIRYMVFKPA
jgi:hypothetical protein